MKSLKEIVLPDSYNYIACFLTLKCNIGCEYCINTFSGSRVSGRADIDGEKWEKGLNRIITRRGLPVTIQGGEPGLHPDFIKIINGIKESIEIDILTNLSFDVESFIKYVDPARLRRQAPYPSIRVSYHPDYMELDEVIDKTLRMLESGFSIGVFGILHPEFREKVMAAREKCLKLGIDFRTKEFLGTYNGKLYGSYLYPDAVGSGKRKKCLCRSTELIIGPECGVYRCHHDLYKGFPPVGNLLDPDFEAQYVFRECGEYGDCNPCDIKIKTNRFQEYGHTSVEIRPV